jgi:hypothetical protein
MLEDVVGIQRHQHDLIAIGMATHLLDDVLFYRESLSQLHFEAYGVLVKGIAIVWADVISMPRSLRGDWRGSRSSITANRQYKDAGRTRELCAAPVSLIRLARCARRDIERQQYLENTEKLGF